MVRFESLDSLSDRLDKSVIVEPFRSRELGIRIGHSFASLDQRLTARVTRGVPRNCRIITLPPCGGRHLLSHARQYYYITSCWLVKPLFAFFNNRDQFADCSFAVNSGRFLKRNNREFDLLACCVHNSCPNESILTIRCHSRGVVELFGKLCVIERIQECIRFSAILANSQNRLEIDGVRYVLGALLSFHRYTFWTWVVRGSLFLTPLL